MTRKRHAEIAGAGFAGLAAATALCQRGWTVRVHEVNPVPRAFGAGIFIWDNGLRVPTALGAYPDVRRGAFAAPAYETRTDGKCLSFQPINGAGQYRLLTMTRQHLYAAMLKAAMGAGAEIVTSSEAVGAGPEGELHLADGTRLAADIVIGADGVRSKVRDSLQVPQERNKYKDGIIRIYDVLFPAQVLLDTDRFIRDFLVRSGLDGQMSSAAFHLALGRHLLETRPGCEDHSVVASALGRALRLSSAPASWVVRKNRSARKRAGHEDCGDGGLRRFGRGAFGRVRRSLFATGRFRRKWLRRFRRYDQRSPHFAA